MNSHAYTTKTYHEVEPLPIGTFVPKRKLSHVHFSNKLKPLWIGPYKILDRLSDVTYELFSQNGSTVHVQRNHLIPYYSKEPLLYPHLCNFMRFSVSTQFSIPKPIKYANSDSSLLIPMNLNPTKIYHKTLLYHQLHLITILKLLTK